MEQTRSEDSASLQQRVDLLQQELGVLDERLERMERALNNLEQARMLERERLDSRYPTRESIHLRFDDVQSDILVLKKWAEEHKRRIDRIQSWQYKLMGGIGVAVFVLGILVKLFVK